MSAVAGLLRGLPAGVAIALVGCALLGRTPSPSGYDLVVLHGRVVDPESGYDGVANLGVRAGRVAALTAAPLAGVETIDARGLVVAPGFIDLHVHGNDAENYAVKVRDGVTTALELEIGIADVDAWYAEREGGALVNYGTSVGHAKVRMAVMHDPGSFLPRADAAHRPATAEERSAIEAGLARGLARGALGVGFGIQYTPAASREEIVDAFRVAAAAAAACHVHLRYMGGREPESAVAALEEVLAASTVTGAPLHVVHVHSSGLRTTPELLRMIGEAQARGLDVTTEAYPYTAMMTRIESALFDRGWQEMLGIGFADLQWPATGERLTAKTFARYRQTGGLVIAHAIPEGIARAAVVSPLTIIASDGLLENGAGHPRSAGTFARVLGRFVRDDRALDLREALAKMTVRPARRVERRAPAMRQKGRVRVGADADLTIFDAARVVDRATYAAPALASEGIAWVLVNGVAVVRDGQLIEGVRPGRAVRAPVDQ